MSMSWDGNVVNREVGSWLWSGKWKWEYVMEWECNE